MMNTVPETVNDLAQYFQNNEDRLIRKWHHYFEVYESHFNRFRDREVVILEVGVSQGGSLRMWKEYFGPRAKIYAIDVNPQCKQCEEENVEIFIGSQSDRNFLREVKRKIPPIDILIDDGGHSMQQQIVTFEELFDHVKDRGVYLCEDLHTSYWMRWGGGHKRRNTFIEYSKNFIDYLHAYHSRQRSLQVSEFTRSVNSIHYYDSIIVLEKRRRDAKPTKENRGTMTFDYPKKQRSLPRKVVDKAREYALIGCNKVLMKLRLGSIGWR